MNIVYFIIILQIFNIILISSIILINKFNNKNKNNISHRKVTANNLTYNCNKNTLPQLCGNTKLSEHFEPYDGSYTNGFSVNNVLCSDLDVSRSLNTTADINFYNTTETEPNKTDKNKTITITATGDINVKTIDNYKVNDKTLLQALYPKGSIYMSMNSTNPETFIGGKWTQITDKFLYCTTTNSTKTGGSDTATLNIENIPSHNHSITLNCESSNPKHKHGIYSSYDDGSFNHGDNGPLTWSGNNSIPDDRSGWAPNNFSRTTYTNDTDINHKHKITGSIGYIGGKYNKTSKKQETQPFSILPSYIKIYCWYRTE